MKGLLLKDYYLSLKYYKSYLLILLVFGIISVWSGYNPFLISYPFMLISLMPLGLQGLDEGCKWDAYCGSMPCTKRQMVSEKYLFDLIWAALGLAVVLISQLIHMALNGGIVMDELAGVLTVCLTLIFFLPSISLPFVFKLGAEKGRISQFIVIGLVCGGATFLSILGDSAVSVVTSVNLSNLVLVLAALAVYILSWFLSIRFYEKREIR